MKKMIKKWLDNLAKENEKTFGDKPLDCCKLNRENDKKHRQVGTNKKNLEK